jgi:hypothetical protein
MHGTTFIAVFHGPNPDHARIVAVTTEPSIVDDVVGRLLAMDANADDPVLEQLEAGRRSALKLIAGRAAHVQD